MQNVYMTDALSEIKIKADKLKSTNNQQRAAKEQALYTDLVNDDTEPKTYMLATNFINKWHKFMLKLANTSGGISKEEKLVKKKLLSE